jgi:hypothetical protein
MVQNLVILVRPVPLLAHPRRNLIALTSGRHSAQNPISTAKSAASDASMADDWDGDVDQGRVNMTSGSGTEYTPSHNLCSTSKYHHTWRHEVPHRNCADICQACLMEATCGSCEDLKGSSASYERDRFELECVCHSAYNNWSAGAELALLETMCEYRLSMKE